MEWRAEPGAAADPAQSSDRRSITRSLTLGSHSVLVRGPQGWPQADQRQMRDRAQSADLPGRLSATPLHTPGRWLLRMESDQGAKSIPDKPVLPHTVQSC